MPKLIDMTGQVMKEHGILDSRITVLEKASYKLKDGHYPWKCKCSCGNIIYSTGSNLRNGNVKSCGCLNKQKASQNAKIRNISNKPSLIDMTGWIMKEHGVENSKLNVIKYLGNSFWECQCECGNICVVDSTRLRNGTTRSCGCINSLNESKIKKFLQENNIEFEEQYSFNDLKLKRKLKFDFGIKQNGILQFLIEYQGKQHYDNTNFGKSARNTDPIKKEYCQNHNIKLYEIKYNENTIEKLIEILKGENFNV